MVRSSGPALALPGAGAGGVGFCGCCANSRATVLKPSSGTPTSNLYMLTDEMLRLRL